MSRPKKEVTRSEVVKVKLTKDEKEALKTYCKATGLTMSEVLRRFAFRYYEGGKDV